jgi:hypothetical protein
MAIKHNQQLQKNRESSFWHLDFILDAVDHFAQILTHVADFRKDWQRRVKVHFEQVIPLSFP